MVLVCAVVFLAYLPPSAPPPERGQSLEAGTASAVVRDTTVPAYDVAEIERLIHLRVNVERTDRSLDSLSQADSLRPLGRMHSRDMAQRGFFGHSNPDGEGVNERAARLGLTCERAIDERTTATGFGENLYRGTLFTRYRDVIQNGERLRREFDWKTEEGIARDVVGGWMDSPGHRANILEPLYATHRIAVYVDGTDFFVTQIFC